MVKVSFQHQLVNVSTPSSTNLDLYITVPSTGTPNYLPDYSYAITVLKNSTFSTSGGTSPVNFLLTEDECLILSQFALPFLSDVY